ASYPAFPCPKGPKPTIFGGINFDQHKHFQQFPTSPMVRWVFCHNSLQLAYLRKQVLLPGSWPQTKSSAGFAVNSTLCSNIGTPFLLLRRFEPRRQANAGTTADKPSRAVPGIPAPSSLLLWHWLPLQKRVFWRTHV